MLLESEVVEDPTTKKRLIINIAPPKDDLDSYLKQTHYGDIEAIGFWEVVKTLKDIHCLCTITEDNKVILWHDRPEFDGKEVWDKEDGVYYKLPPRAGTLLEGFRYWFKIGRANGRLSVHNTMTYDKPIIEKVLPKCLIPNHVWRDTFNQSKLQYADRPCPKGAKSAHGLLAYGIKFGVRKPPITDFTIFDEYILHRVIEDCRIQKKTQEYLDKEASILLEKGICFEECSVIEDEYARGCAAQDVHGALVDEPHMDRCLVLWDEELEVIAAEVEPQLPPTLKPNTARITRSEMMLSIGYPKSKIPFDKQEFVTKDKKQVQQACKPYYKPSANFHNMEKVTFYSAFNMSVGQSPKFAKKTGDNSYTSWRNEHHPDTKPADWEVDKEVIETKVLNAHTCKYFDVEPTDLHIICGPHTKITFTKSSMSQHEVVKGLLIRLGLTYVDEWNLKRDANKQIIKATVDTWIGYPKKAAIENQMRILIKKGQALVSSPKIGEKDYAQLPKGLGQKIGSYNTTLHRRRYIENVKDPEEKGLKSKIREDGRISCGVNNFGTNTGRSTHRNIVNLPSESSMYGKEMRQIIIAPEGKCLIGIDQASAQLQICAFVTNNVEYYEAVAKGKELVDDFRGAEYPKIYKGESAHCFNARSFQLISHEEWQEGIKNQDPKLIHHLSLMRKQAKGPAFASLFGCAPPKLASMLSIPVDEAKLKLAAFLSSMGLDAVQEWLKQCAIKYGRGRGFYIPTAFGYWVYCKSPHAAVNYLIQSVEGAVQKVAVNYFERELVKRGLNKYAAKILDMHDEYLVECILGHEKEVSTLMCESYTYAGAELHKWYKQNPHMYSGEGDLAILCDFNGGASIGKNYYECH